MLTRLPKCSFVPILPLEEARSKLCSLFRRGSEVIGALAKMREERVPSSSEKKKKVSLREWPALTNEGRREAENFP